MRRSRWLVVAAGLVAVSLVVAGAVVAVRWWRDRDRTDLERAVTMAPQGTQRYSWTDWAGVRAAVGVNLSGDSSAKALGDFLDGAYNRDLTSASALGESAASLQRDFGFSPATLDWELLSQSREGALLTMALPEGSDLSRVAERLRAVGYAEPDDPEQPWEAGEAVLGRYAGELTPTLANIALDDDADLLLASDSAEYLRGVLAAGETAPPDGVAQVVEASGEPLSAAVYTGEQACSALAMASTDPTTQDDARQLIAAAGEVHPLTGFAMSAQRGGDVRVAMAFESEDAARVDARTRSVLASGPAPGQGGDFPERFTLGEVRSRGRIVTMELQPAPGTFVLSDLSNGPLLFATC